MMRHILALLFLLVGSVQAGTSLASEVFRNGSEIKIEAPIGVLPVSGFLPLRVEMRNAGRSEMSWSLTCESSLGNSYEMPDSDAALISSSFSVGCPAGEDRSVDLLVPVHTRAASRGHRVVSVSGYSEGLKARINGSLESEGLDFVLGVSEALLGDLINQIAEAWDTDPRYFGGYGGYSSVVLGGEIDVDQLPADWRAYSGYDALALASEEYLKQEKGVKLALDQWVRSGGNLILLGESETSPEGFGRKPRTNGLGVQSFLGCGREYLDFDGEEFRKLVAKQETPLLKKIDVEYSSNSWTVGTELGARKLQKSLLLVALIVFGIIVGPINLFFWAGKNRRHRLFFTTPLISVVASVLLVGYIVLRDGFGGDGARAVLIEVGGPDDKTSVILQEQFSRNGILFSSNFSIDDQTVLVPVMAPQSDLNRYDSVAGTGRYHLEATTTNEGWDFTGDLYQSRSENAQVIRAVTPSRERLDLLPESSGAPKLTSSFSYSLTSIIYTDENGEVWQASSIEPGGTVTMSAAGQTNPKEVFEDVVSRFGKFNQQHINRLFERKGSFAAIAENVPGVETHPSIDWKESPTLITGLLSQ